METVTWWTLPLKPDQRALSTRGWVTGGTFPTVKEALKEATAKGVVVIRGSRTGSGITTLTAEDDKNGFVASGALNSQKARILLMLALTKTNSIKEIRRIFNEY
jgi:asparaginase (EC 3.5.1.1)